MEPYLISAESLEDSSHKSTAFFQLRFSRQCRFASFPPFLSLFSLVDRARALVLGRAARLLADGRLAGGGRRRAGELGLQALPAGRSRPGTGRAAPYRQPARPSAATAAPSGRRCHPPPAAAARPPPRSWATATTPSQSDCMPTLPIPGRAEPRFTPPWCARRQACWARGPAALLLLLSPTAAGPPTRIYGYYIFRSGIRNPRSGFF